MLCSIRATEDIVMNIHLESLLIVKSMSSISSQYHIITRVLMGQTSPIFILGLNFGLKYTVKINFDHTIHNRVKSTLMCRFAVGIS